MARSYTLSVHVNQKIGDTFDAILNYSPKIIHGAKSTSNDWQSFSTTRKNAKLKFKKNKSLEILDYVFIDLELKWDVPIRIISNDCESKIVITLVKSNELTDDQFNQRVIEIENAFQNMKKIIEEP